MPVNILHFFNEVSLFWLSFEAFQGVYLSNKETIDMGEAFDFQEINIRPGNLDSIENYQIFS